MKIVILALSLILVGCSTVSGIGKDLQDSADWTRSKISKPAPVKEN